MTTVRASEQIERALSAEFGAWCNTRPDHPDHNFSRPTTAGGLPDGWRVRSTMRSDVPVWVSSGLPDDEPVPTRTYWHVVSRRDGGWVLVHYYRNASTRRGIVTLDERAATLAALYRRVCAAADAGAFHPDKARAKEEAVRRFIASRYNLADPDEAAEHMLVALGQRPTLIPARLAPEEPRSIGVAR